MIDKKQLPEGWRIVELRDVSKAVTGTTPPKSNSKNYGIDIPFVKPPQLFDGSISNAPEKLSFQGAKLARLLPPNSVLVTCIGNLGRTAINNVAVAFNQQINALIPSDQIIGKFLFYQAQSGDFKKQLNNLSSATTVAIVNKGKFETIRISLPPISEQAQIINKIEELFSELDKGIENLKIAQQQLKVYRQAVLKWAFEGKLTDGNVKDGELPEGWSWVKLITLGQLGRGKSKHRPRNEKSLFGGKYPFIQTGEVKAAGHIIKSYTQTYSEKGLAQSKLWKKGTLCITIAANIAETAFLGFDGCFPDSIVGFTPDEKSVNPEYIFYFFKANQSRLESFAPATAQKNINLNTLENLIIPYCSVENQKAIVQEIESRLSVCDKIEETIANSLLQAEALRQSIFKKAFEGKLVKAQVQPLYKPKNTYFYQMQLLGIVAAASKEKGINHGEMTIAKYAYLLDKVYQIPTYYDYKRWHLGPYPPEIKKAINNAKFFTKKNNSIEVKDIDTLTKYINPYSDKLKNAVDDLSDIFAKYTANERPHQIELLATVGKVIEDIQSTDLLAIRDSMADWKIDLANTHFKSKAEKFSEEETKECLELILVKGWAAKLIDK